MRVRYALHAHPVAAAGAQEPGRGCPSHCAQLPATRFLGERAAAELLARLGALGIAGGAVYETLVGAAAVEHGLTLMTRDRRAADIYRRLDAEFVLVD